MRRSLRLRRITRAFALSSGLLLVDVGLAAADPKAEAEEDPAPPRPPVIDVAPIVVTATKRETAVEETGASVTVVDGEELRRRGSRDLLEALRDVPGVSVVQTGSRGGTSSLFVRGGESDHNLVLIDGVQVNRAGGSFDFANLTTEAIERVEIVRGPLSGLYGSDALASAINIITKHGEGPRRLELSFTGGSHSSFEEAVSLSEGSDRWSYLVSVGRYDTDGLERLNNQARNTSARLRTHWSPTEDLSLDLTTWYTDSAFDFPTDFVLGERGGFPPVDPDQGRRTRELVVGVGGSWEAAEWWTHRLQVGFTSSRNRNFDGLDPIPSDRADRETVDRERRLTADYSQLLRLPIGQHVRTAFTWGFEYEKELFRQESETSVPGSFSTTRRINQSRNTMGYYSQLEVAVADQLFLTGGARVDDNSEFGLFVSPFGSVTWQIPGAGTRLRATVGRGFKEPTFRENFGSTFVAGNPDLEPERSFSWEAGVDQELWQGRLRLFATYFENEFSDLIAFVGPFGSPTATFENVQRTEATGVETGFAIRIAGGLRTGASYTYLRTSVVDDGGLGNSAFREGEPLLRRPAHSGSFWIDYGSDRWNARLSGTVVGSRIDRDFGVFPERRVRNPGYVKLDLYASYLAFRHESTGAELRLTGVVENLLDEDFEEAFGFRSPGLEARGGLELRF